MNPFECCHKCVAPKRYPGCAGQCEEYQEARKKWEAQKVHIRKEKQKQQAIDSVRVKSSSYYKPRS